MLVEHKNRDNFIIKHLPLVKKVVGRIETNNNMFESDDLVSIGVIGLMDAIEKYDYSKNVPFEAYATLRIRGTVIDELRRSGRVSRDKIDKLNRYYEAKEKLENEMMKTPDEIEVCNELGLNDVQLAKIHETIHYLSSYSLESTLFTKDGDDFSLMDTIKDESIISSDDKLINDEKSQALIKAIDRLKERERIILSLYYVEELSLKEIAYTLNISIPRVSQVHGKVLSKLRTSIEDILGGKYV